MVQSFLLFIITLFAYFVKGITGFGNTLVMSTLFSFFKENRFTTPVDLLLGIPTNGYLTWKERRALNYKIVIPLSIMMVLGDTAGAFFLELGNDHLLKAVLGIVVVGIGIEMITRKTADNNSMRGNPILLAAIGVFSGILAGLYGIGAPIIAYISRTTSNRNEYRANLCCIFLVDNIYRCILYYYRGILNWNIFFFALFLAPAVAVGMFIGVKVDLRLKEITVKNAVIILLILSGTVLFLTNTVFR